MSCSTGVTIQVVTWPLTVQATQNRKKNGGRVRGRLDGLPSFEKVSGNRRPLPDGTILSFPLNRCSRRKGCRQGDRV